MESFVRDVMFAFRSLRRQPAFAITAVLTIALGIGATSAIFSVVNAVLLRPLPYNDAARLGTVWSDLRNRNVMDFPLPPGDFFDLRKDTTQFDGFAAITSFRPTIGGDGQGDSEQVPAARSPPTSSPCWDIASRSDAISWRKTARRNRRAAAGRRGAAARRAAASATAEHRHHQPRVLAAALRRRRVDRRQVDRVRQRPRRHRRRARAGISRSCFRRAPTSTRGRTS